MRYQIYGSGSSIDVDIMVIVDSLGNIDENKKIIEKLKEELQPRFEKKIDVHLAVLEDGMIIDVSHGTYDECNNSLYLTYGLHQQEYPNAIERMYVRCDTDFMHIKMIRVSRFFLSFFSREPELRQKIKPALKGDFIERLKALSLIKFETYTDFPKKNELKEDIYKVVAFQFAQVFGLLKGLEIYTKEQAMHFMPELSKFIMREPLDERDLKFLSRLLIIFITLSYFESGRMKTLIEPQGN